MSENENELKKALAENGNFDAEKARRLAAEAVSRFNLRLRWTERRGMIGLLLCMAVFEFAFIKFTLASTTKTMIGYAVVMLLSYGIGITAVFVSRIMSVLLRVLKEIKQSQLESLGYPADREISASNGARQFVGALTSAWLVGDHRLAACALSRRFDGCLHHLLALVSDLGSAALGYDAVSRCTDHH